MSGLVFFFAITSVSIFLYSSSTSLCSYAVSHKKSLLYLALFLLLYSLESIFVFSNEFASSMSNFAIDDFGDAEAIGLRVVLAIVEVQMLWLVFCEFFQLSSKKMRYIPVAVYALISLFALILLEGVIEKWLVYTLRQSFILFAIGFSFYNVKTSEYCSVLKKQKKTIAFFVVLTIFVVLTVAEDTANMIYSLPQHLNLLPGLAEFLYRRNISETLLVLSVSIYAIYRSVRTLKINSASLPAVSQDKFNLRLGEISLLFSAKYSLTARESEILNLVIQEYEYQRIANKLHLAVGTVKTHVHNILKKTNTHSRRDLSELFWGEG